MLPTRFVSSQSDSLVIQMSFSLESQIKRISASSQKVFFLSASQRGKYGGVAKRERESETESEERGRERERRQKGGSG